MAERIRAIADPVEIWHDGARLTAQRGEPLACTLIAENRLPIVRSTKLHRPRGPYCFRGACDGCLARVNGVANVMTCQAPAGGGERIETQNVLGSRDVDLLGAADFLFPRGIDHHRLFAGVRGVSSLLQAFARRVAGLGELPERIESPRPASQREVDVLVVGAGSAGLSAAGKLGGRALVVDDQPEPGGALFALDPERARTLIAEASAAGAEIMSRVTACALSREPDDGSGRVTAILAGAGGMVHARCRTVLLATGTHDPVRLFENNDLPGVLSARAALGLLQRGVSLGQRIALIGEGRFAERFAALAPATTKLERLAPDAPLRALGKTRVSAVVAGTEQRRTRVDAILVDGAGAPSFELAVQAGAKVSFEPTRGYTPRAAESGEVAPAVFCAGSCRGAADSGADGEHVAKRL